MFETFSLLLNFLKLQIWNTFALFIE